MGKGGWCLGTCLADTTVLQRQGLSGPLRVRCGLELRALLTHAPGCLLTQKLYTSEPCLSSDRCLEPCRTVRGGSGHRVVQGRRQSLEKGRKCSKAHTGGGKGRQQKTCRSRHREFRAPKTLPESHKITTYLPYPHVP